MQYNTISVKATREYDICIGRGILAGIGDMISPILGKCRLAVLTDSNVDALYGSTMMEYLASAGYDACKYVIPAGEASKCAENLLAFLTFLAQEQLTRSDAVVAFGGGVVGDLGGLSASLYLRGVKYIQVPTTLLAAVDSSVGGKTAIDIPAGKNLVGSFYQPSLVCCDTALMDSLPSDIYRDGCAEVIKYGMILDARLYDTLHTIPFDREAVVARCIEIKRDVVQQDEFDNGVRGLLNFGHTFGHAIEKLSDFGVSHGEAVAKGMVIAARIAPLCGLCDVADELSALLLQYGFDITCGYSANEIYNALLSDKKRRGGNISVILPRAIGECVLYDMPVEELKGLLQKVM
ncbi:MAG: 3-dehydroquinate synthase [Bacteroidaceae bacterium]|nr:3-dehydroquinate synthase [Bacteroidaceae bacterium]